MTTCAGFPTCSPSNQGAGCLCAEENVSDSSQFPAGENHLFRWLMESQPEWKGRINQKDQDGCTVLHVVAAYSPGYLVKRKWRCHRGGRALGWGTSGVGEPTQQAVTFYPCRPVTGSGGNLPGVEHGGEGRLRAERGRVREGGVAGISVLCHVASRGSGDSRTRASRCTCFRPHHMVTCCCV